MARPKSDSEGIKLSLVETAETLLRETAGRRLVLSEIAARTGMSQSYVHRFFPTKDDLIRTLAERWFNDVEMRLAPIAQSTDSAENRLATFILTMLAIKRDRFDDDPILFRAYMALASEQMELVAMHGMRLRKMLSLILKDLVPFDDLQTATDLVEDATTLFRVPMMIALFRHRVTDERAKAVVQALLYSLSNSAGGKPPPLTPSP